MNFTSQICTTREQSERLLALGLKKETADCHYEGRKNRYEEWEVAVIGGCYYSWDYPAWSLHRLIEMLTYQVVLNGKKYKPVIDIDGIAYQEVWDNEPIVGWSRQLYDDVIDCIEWLINIEQFNKEYLEKWV
jgi:hypothetical protein